MDFENVSGNLALDLVGTLWWRRDRPCDLLASTADADAWSASAGVLPARVHGSADLDALRHLRELIYRECARCLADRIPVLEPMATGPSELSALISAARVPPPWPEAPRDGLRWVGGPESLRSQVARAALRLLDPREALPVKECGSARCTRLFVDRSGGRRVWCGMSTCGNREKAARWRARHAR